jgi:hypothetical protein
MSNILPVNGLSGVCDLPLDVAERSGNYQHNILTYEEFGEMFEGDLADTCENNSHVY